ncbi:jg19170 [Pararge aegeria aegeria]|uniref:Jg19170 protein n=1 Tax=Pararge aegeria aegeria TaxID=348720 RepID=A0A8S4SK35_9NEOP|nr:jg19170 [Pararge aegeria aegeria]
MDHVGCGRGRSIQRRLRGELSPGTLNPPVIPDPFYPSECYLFSNTCKCFNNRRSSRLTGRLIACQLRKNHLAPIILLPVLHRKKSLSGLLLLNKFHIATNA